MPTPVHVYAEIAARYGSVDPTDRKAVLYFFKEILPELPQAIRDEISEELLLRDGELEKP